MGAWEGLKAGKRLCVCMCVCVDGEGLAAAKEVQREEAELVLEV